MVRDVIYCWRPLGICLMAAAAFAVLHALSAFIELGWLVERVDHLSRPTMDKTSLMLYGVFALPPLVVFRGKAPGVRETRLERGLRELLRWLGRSSAYVLCGASGLLLGVGLADILHSGQILSGYIVVALSGLSLGLIVYMTPRITEALRHHVGRSTPEVRRQARVFCVIAFFGMALAACYDLWLKAAGA